MDSSWKSPDVSHQFSSLASDDVMRRRQFISHEAAWQLCWTPMGWQSGRKRCDLTEQTNTKYFRIRWNVLKNILLTLYEKFLKMNTGRGKGIWKKGGKIIWGLYFLLKDRKPIQFSHQLVLNFHCTAEVHFSGALRACQALPQRLHGLPHPCIWPCSRGEPLGAVLWPCLQPCPRPCLLQSLPGSSGCAWLWLTPSPSQGLRWTPAVGDITHWRGDRWHACSLSRCLQLYKGGTGSSLGAGHRCSHCAGTNRRKQILCFLPCPAPCPGEAAWPSSAQTSGGGTRPALRVGTVRSSLRRVCHRPSLTSSCRAG